MKDSVWISAKINRVDDLLMTAGLYATDILNANSMDLAKFRLTNNCPSHESCNARCLTVTCGVIGLIQSTVNARYQKNARYDFQIDRSVVVTTRLDN